MIAAMGLMLTACQEKKQPYNIIVKKEQAPKPTKTLAIGDYVQKYHVEWLGKDYTITVAAKADSTLDKVSDGTRKYYDNRIALTIDREDGTQFLHREFTKNDFSAHVDAGYLDNRRWWVSCTTKSMATTSPLLSAWARPTSRATTTCPCSSR